jgi:hypothetical protein
MWRQATFCFLARSLATLGHGSAASRTDSRSYPQIQGIICRQRGEERVRPRQSRFFIGSAPLTSITEADAQISGGETRQDLKIPAISLQRLPLALSCSRHAVYVLWWKHYLNHHVPFRLDSSLQAGLYARTPRSARLLRHPGNYRLESNPERHGKTPLTAAIGNRIHRARCRVILHRILEVTARVRLH